jgi:hypothetical protein
MEPEDPEGPGLTASCELDALAAARSEEGSGRVRFQYGTNLVCEDEAVGSRGSAQHFRQAGQAHPIWFTSKALFKHS